MKNFGENDTIVAISTPPGEGGIGIIRISGENSGIVASKLFKCAKKDLTVENFESHKVVYGKIVDEKGNVIDEALCIAMWAPNSYTKENVVEIQSHGGALVVRRILELALQNGARMAEPGEFTKRAFLNGRLDLSQAQSVMDIIKARTDASLRMAAGHLQGKFSDEIKAMRHDILEVIAHLEASIDFPEDDIEDVAKDEASAKVRSIKNRIEEMLSTFNTGRILRDGLVTAIIGKPNVGKSSLLNTLLREDRAIVTDIPGTTRDSLEEYANIGGVPLKIIDTAGIRETEDRIEQIGIERTKQEISKADVILEIRDIRERQNQNKDSMKTALEMIKGKDVPIITVLNKVDLISSPILNTKDVSRGTIIETSAVTGKGMQELKSELLKLAGFSENQSIYMARERHIHNLLNVKESLKRAASYLNSSSPQLELFAEELRGASDELGEITGKISSDDLLGKIFSGFCIGK